MTLRLYSLVLLVGLLHAPLLADEPSETDAPPSAEAGTEADDEARDAPPSSDDFRPTEQLRWDQEVDFPTDI